MQAVDFRTVLKDIHGVDLERVKKPATETEPAVIEPMTAGHASIDALMIGDAQEKDGTTKVKCYRLALLISAASEPIELKAEDTLLLKAKIGVAWAPIIVGRMYDLLGE